MGVERGEATRHHDPYGFIEGTHTMNTRTQLRVTGAALIMIAGMACSAWAQTGTPTTSRAQPATVHSAVDALPHFVDCHALSGEDVANPNGDVVATVDDLIVDRGSGRVAYAVLKSGDVLGLGGKRIAVPYDSLTYDRLQDRFNIRMTSEQIERAAEFSPEEWSNLEHTSWTEDLEAWWDETFPDTDNWDDDDDWDWRDPYAGTFDGKDKANRKPTTIEGEITGVDRDRKLGREYACVTVRDSEGRSRRVVLGPSWYVMGGPAAPMRGDTIKAKAFACTADEDPETYVAVNATIRDKPIELRDDWGVGRWDAPVKTASGEGRVPKDKSEGERVATRRWGSGQLMLMSDLVDAPASANDKSGGEIQQVILEERSGQIAFIGFDPNENVLGIADEIVLVPWTLVSVDSEHEARIDANQEMLVASQEVPDDLDTLSSQERLGRIYEAYGIEPETFGERRESMRGEMPSSRWSADGELMRAFRDGEEESVDGRIVEVRHETLFAGEPDAIIVVVDTGVDERHVVVGPSWYMTRQRVEFKSGDPISVVGTRGVVDGRELIGAKSVKRGDRTIVLWTKDKAVWNED